MSDMQFNMNKPLEQKRRFRSLLFLVLAFVVTLVAIIWYFSKEQLAKPLVLSLTPAEQQSAIQDKMNNADSSVLEQMKNDPELEKYIQDAEEADAQGTESPDEADDAATDAPEDAVPTASVTNK